MSLSAKELQALDSAHYIHPFTDTAALAKKQARASSSNPFALSKAKGLTGSNQTLRIAQGKRHVASQGHGLGQPQKKTIIGRWNGYHGSTMADASLGGMKSTHQQGGLPIPDIVHIQQPYWFEVGRTQYPELSKDEFGIKAALWLADAIVDVGPDRVAACALYWRAGARRKRRDHSTQNLLARNSAHLQKNTMYCWSPMR